MRNANISSIRVSPILAPAPDPTEPGDGGASWSTERVAAWLETAFRVLACLREAEDPSPRPGPRKLANSWDAIAGPSRRPRMIVTDAQRAIYRRVLEVEQWPFWIERDEHFQATVFQACGVGPERLARRLGVNRATIWRWRQAGLRRIRDQLNARARP